MANTERRPGVAGNWKMHHTHLEASQVVQKLSYRLEQRDYDECEIVVCPAFTALRSVQTVLESDRIPIRLGAQDVHWKDQGAFTGEVSPPMLAKLNVSYVIVGHSERRQLFGETDEIVNQKLKAVLKHEMTPIVCVGETLDEHESGRTDERVDAQTRAASTGVRAAGAGQAVVAYEPIWAIGTGRNATPEDANATISLFSEAVLPSLPSQAKGPERVLNAILLLLDIASAGMLILFVLLHAGRGGGLSDMFGGQMGGSMAGSTVVERNLDRITVVTAIVFTFS